VEEGVEAPRRRRRRHVDEGVALVVLCPAPQRSSDRRKQERQVLGNTSTERWRN
jgi:hypothetical protein